mmetsp:Transcript_59798/g.129539  ORF Transcript_59798/g.129539 Transcript_59798/m.129539 type:complete len:236 (-) Transcript_59798:153-860(-)|eukprot:CAMPEP_0170597980 /NCGR_PEP_ID=MMETSP0224-20130122/15998_1 /TAXON_ID=285029 /ORGANISM="Togula jolla, Strain CCCM 725" /LENGTH=235 /DNA_ID=CAMNT_0010922491 /DNA_START=37 /DNA_END=744 /DNA_ORIENTATION=+
MVFIRPCVRERNSVLRCSNRSDPYEQSADVAHIIAAVVESMDFPATVADPQQEDCPVIAASPDFVALTQYPLGSIVGRNCRFLNKGCDSCFKDKRDMRLCAETGKHFCGVLANQRADGSYFLNHLDMRGLKVGRFLGGEDEKWFIIAVHTDVTEGDLSRNPCDQEVLMQKIYDAISDSLKESLSSSTSMTAKKGNNQNPLHAYEKPLWVIGEANENQSSGTKAKATRSAPVTVSL